MHHIICRSDLVWRPWKNGGGQMADIAVSPNGADFDRADWRVSIAKVEREGAFSLFPGMDRGMMLLAGKSLELHIDNDPPLLVESSGGGVSFPGDRPTRGVPIGGVIEDLNVMIRRGVVQQRMIRWICEGASWLPVANGGTTLVVVQQGEIRLSGSATIRDGDTLIADTPVRIEGAADLIEINLWLV